jgi:hypothetical protein
MGAVVKSRGEDDSLFAVFARPTNAVAAAAALQRALQAEPWSLAATPERDDWTELVYKKRDFSRRLARLLV